MTKNELLKAAIQKWGAEHQINKIQEEALELALVLNQLKCVTKNPEQMEERLYDELADMAIMVEYFPLLFDWERIERVRAFKLNRMKEKYFNS